MLSPSPTWYTMWLTVYFHSTSVKYSAVVVLLHRWIRRLVCQLALSACIGFVAPRVPPMARMSLGGSKRYFKPLDRNSCLWYLECPNGSVLGHELVVRFSCQTLCGRRSNWGLVEIDVIFNVNDNSTLRIFRSWSSLYLRCSDLIP